MPNNFLPLSAPNLIFEHKTYMAYYTHFTALYQMSAEFVVLHSACVLYGLVCSTVYSCWWLTCSLLSRGEISLCLRNNSRCLRTADPCCAKSPQKYSHLAVRVTTRTKTIPVTEKCLSKESANPTNTTTSLLWSI